MRYAVSRVIFQKSLILISIILISVAGLFVGVLSARADIAPPQSPPGANPEVDQSTLVRMMDEKVVITIQEEYDLDQMGSASVWAEFHMKNLGDTPEVLMVRFPSSFSDGRSGYPEIENFLVYVDNAQATTSRVNLEGEPEDYRDPVQWVEFEVVFPPGEIVIIEVEYTLFGTGYYPYLTYGYLLETGAGWNGTIGSAEIIVRLPYRATSANVVLDRGTGLGSFTPGSILSENEIQWHMEEFEPGRQENINICILWPSVWQRILDEQKHVYDFPEDGEAWGMLAKHYKEVSRFDRFYRVDMGGVFLHEQSIAAYQKALDLLPNDALWHAGYADLLMYHSGWEGSGFSVDSRAEFLEGLYQLYLAYQLDSDHEYIQDRLNYLFYHDSVEEENGEYDFLWLTQTPTLAPAISQETAVPQVDPTAVTLVTVTPQPEPTQSTMIDETGSDDNGEGDNVEGKKKFPICGSSLLAPVVLGMMVFIPITRSLNKENYRRNDD